MGSRPIRLGAVAKLATATPASVILIAVDPGNPTMPIYEYRCQECRRISSFLVLNLKEPFVPVCEGCGSQSLERILSRVHVRLSEETRMERLADPAQWGGLDESDPKSMARFMKKMGQEMGEDYPGEVDQMVDEAMESLGNESGDDSG
jgi:putative FmdB family regulatory protein